MNVRHVPGPVVSETVDPPQKRTLNDSPDQIVQSNKQAPDSKQLEAQQAVPPSPTSDQLLGSPDALGDDTMDLDDGAAELDEPVNPRDKAARNTELDAADFYAQHVADLAAQVSLVLSDIVSRNDKTPFSTDKLTRFHSRAPPSISIRDYILRIIKFCNLDKAVLLVLVYLVELFTRSYPSFVLNSLTVHRFLITSCTVAAKGLCDQFCSNTHYAKVGGVSVMELNLLEVEFLTRVSYKIVPPQSALTSSYAQLQEKRASLQASAPLPQLTNPSNADASRSASPNTAGPTASEAKPAARPQGWNTSLASVPTRTGETRKHAREDSVQPSSSDPEEARPKAKGFKAMKGTLRFLNPTKKKRSEDAD